MSRDKEIERAFQDGIAWQKEQEENALNDSIKENIEVTKALISKISQGQNMGIAPPTSKLWAVTWVSISILLLVFVYFLSLAV